MKKRAGEAAFIQRCQLHKRRNGLAHPPEQAEGREERLTLHRLGCPEKLRKTLFSTNPIESAFSVVEEKCGRVKKWQGGDIKLRWVASGLLFAEEQFRRVKGYREIPRLVAAMQAPAAESRKRLLSPVQWGKL